MCREGWEVGILGCIDHPLFRIGKAKLTKNGDTVLVAGLIEQASAEFEVLSVRPHGRQGQAAPAFFCAVLLGEHLGHAGPACSSEAEGDVDVVRRQVMWQATIEARAIDVDHFPMYGRIRDLVGMEACWQAVCDGTWHGEEDGKG